MPEIKPGMEYPGTVVKGADPSQKGMCMVHIPELMPHMPNDKGWPVKNHCHNWRVHKTTTGVAGQKFPIHPGATVMVKFYQEDESTGYIDRVISDGIEKSDLMAPEFSGCGSAEDRDEQYLLATTPKKKSMIYINEDTSAEPNTLYIIHNDKKSIIKLADTGFNIFTESDLTIEAAANVYITGRAQVNICGTSGVNVDGATIHLNSGNFAGGKAADKS